jgi:thiamine pyrophosphokinase
MLHVYVRNTNKTKTNRKRRIATPNNIIMSRFRNTSSHQRFILRCSTAKFLSSRGKILFIIFLLSITLAPSGSSFIRSSGVQVQRQPTMLHTQVRYHDSPLMNTTDRTALIILNSPIQNPPSPLFWKLWDMAEYRVCADGGANRLYDATIGTMNGRSIAPNIIRGDLDSVRDDVREYYASKGSTIEPDPCQDTNDLDKSLAVVLKDWVKPGEPHRVCIYGAFGGRFDQQMGCIQALYKWGDTFSNRLFLFDDHTFAILLPPVVRNEIRIPFYGDDPANQQDKTLVGEGPTCGLIPIGSRCEFVKTTGLKWNLDGSSLEFGGTVSTSNRAMEDVVVVQSSHPIVFTAEVSSGSKPY